MSLLQPPRHATPIVDMPPFMVNRVQPACTPDDAEDFFRDNAGSYPQLTLDLCANCIVREQCLEWALNNQERYGVWGGTTPKQRRKILRQRVAA